MKDIKVSVICITYNHENYIRKALEGFVMQKTNFNFEVLIHDDASTDKTADIIREFEQKYPEIIKPIYQTENQFSLGVKILFEYLFPKAKGEYIAFCEGDDFWLDENKLQRQVDLLDANPQFSACVHKYITVDKQGNKTDIKTFGYYEEEGIYTLKDFETHELPSQLATLVCRNLFLKEETAYPKKWFKIRLQGDVKIFLYLLNHGDIYRMDNVCSAYRFVCEQGGTSWSSRNLGNYRAAYLRWKAVKALENLEFEEYGVRLNLKKRKINNAIAVISCFLRGKFNFESFKYALIVAILQRGIIGHYIKRFFDRK